MDRDVFVVSVRRKLLHDGGEQGHASTGPERRDRGAMIRHMLLLVLMRPTVERVRLSDMMTSKMSWLIR